MKQPTDSDAFDFESISLEQRLRLVSRWSREANRLADAATYRLRIILQRQEAHSRLTELRELHQSGS